MRTYITDIMVAMLVGCFLVGCNTSSSSEDRENTESHAETSYELDGIFISYQNQDRDLYLDYMMEATQSFYILSSTPIQEEDIQVIVPVETHYTVYINDYTEYFWKTMHMIEEEGNGMQVFGGGPGQMMFPQFLYDTYRGMDWSELATLYQEAVEAEKEIEALGPMASITLKDDPEYIALQERVTRFTDYRDQYKEDYNALTKEDISKFYFYNVSIQFTLPWMVEQLPEMKDKTVVSDSFETIYIVIGDQTYTQDIGEVRIHAESLDLKELSPSGDEILQEQSWGDGDACISYPGGDGIGMTMSYIDVYASKDVTLDSISMYKTSKIQILGARVKMSKERWSQGGKAFLDVYWDFKTPLSIPEGTYVQMDLFVQSPVVTEFEYGVSDLLLLEYTADGETYVLPKIFSLGSHGQNPWVRYATLVNLDLDVIAYYDYYRKTEESWRETYGFTVEK